MIYGNKFAPKIDLSINNPKELYDWMSRNIRYTNFTKLMSAQEVYEKRKGSCHDLVQFEDYFFNQFIHTIVVPGVAIATYGSIQSFGRIFAIEYNEGEQKGGRTHSFIWFVKDNKYYWFERAWSSQYGINGPYKTLKDLKSDFKEKMLKESNYENVKFSGIPYSVKPGITLDEYVAACLKSKIRVKLMNKK